MYEPPRGDERPGCRETLVLIRAVFGVLLPPLIAILAVVVAFALAVVLFAVHPLLAIVPIGGVIGAVLIYARWEQQRYQPPEP
jgi:hypothetical protein